MKDKHYEYVNHAKANNTFSMILKNKQFISNDFEKQTFFSPVILKNICFHNFTPLFKMTSPLHDDRLGPGNDTQCFEISRNFNLADDF